MGRNNKDFHSDIPGFEGTMGALNNLTRKRSTEAPVNLSSPKFDAEHDIPDYADHYEERNT